jgi:hypothetical protein
VIGVSKLAIAIAIATTRTLQYSDRNLPTNLSRIV